MLPDLVSNPGPLTYESGALPIAGLQISLEGYRGQNSIYVMCYVNCYNTDSPSEVSILLIIK